MARLPGGAAILPLSDRNDVNGQAIGVGTVHRYFIFCVLEKEGLLGLYLVSCLS